jgi:hypothetical protein
MVTSELEKKLDRVHADLGFDHVEGDQQLCQRKRVAHVGRIAAVGKFANVGAQLLGLWQQRPN